MQCIGAIRSIRILVQYIMAYILYIYSLIMDHVLPEHQYYLFSSRVPTKI